MPEATNVIELRHIEKMGHVLRASVELPTVVFTGLLCIVAGLWLLSLIGLLDIDADVGEGLFDDALEPFNLSEVPTTVILTIFALAGWFVSVLASVFLLDGRSGSTLVVLALVVGLASAAAGLAITAWIAPTLGRVFVTSLAPSKRDLVGCVAEVRSGTVTETTGRGEAVWPDGTVSTIDIRTNEHVGLAAGELQRGDQAFIIDWIESTDDFIVDRVPAELAE